LLFLNEEHIKEAVTMKDVIDAIDFTYEIYASNHFQMPTRLQVRDGDNTLLLMPVLTERAIATKLVTVFPNNTEVPTLHGLVVLNDKQTGQILSLLDGSFLTALRTGAIGGNAVRHFARKDDRKLAIIGTGVQGLHQAIAACTERNISDIYLFNRTKDKIPGFKASLERWIEPNIRLHTANSAKEAISSADIIITATTSYQPVLPDDPALLKEKLIIGIGSFQPTMREFPNTVYKLANSIYVDTEHAIEESGDIAIPMKEGWIKKEDVQTMSSWLTSQSSINRENHSTILFKSVGMALFDVVTANLIYEKAREKRIGVQLDF